MTDLEYMIVIFISACIGGLIGYLFRYLQAEEAKPQLDDAMLEYYLNKRMTENEIIAGIREPTEHD